MVNFVGTAIEELALSKRAKALGVEDMGKLTETGKPDDIDKALAKLEAAKAAAPEYINYVQELISTVGQAVTRIADASGSPKAKELAKEYNKQVGEAAAGLADKALKGKFGDGFGDACNMTSTILDKGLELLGFPHDEKDKDREEIRRLLLLVLAVVATMFLQRFGISTSTLAAGAQIFQFISDNKTKPLAEAAQNAAIAVGQNKEAMGALTDAAIGKAEELVPALKDLGLKDKAKELIDQTLPPQGKAVLEQAQTLEYTMGLLRQDAAEVKKGVLSDLEEVANIVLKDQPELCAQLKDAMSTAGAELEEQLKTSVTPKKPGEKDAPMPERVEKFTQTLSTIDKFIETCHSKIAEGNPELGAVDKLKLGEAKDQMRQYVYEKYGKTAKQFMTAAAAPGADKAAESLGMKKETRAPLVAAIDKLDPAPSRSRG